MRLVVAAVGRLKAGPDRELASRYRDRAAQLGRALGFPACEITEIPESRARRAADRRAEEAVTLLASLSSGGVLLIYDERVSIK